ncbi:MAG: hypothetical protein DRO06_00510 [Thermoproteota archaeon]|mgnify:CR=1 FL=1|nr:MAG: hypothetical protein DRO06_00510 [Candidatus Korarchaeota archaeon]
MRRGSSGVVRVTRGLGLLGYSVPARPWLVVAWKEIVEALRDRRTITTTILMPMVLMPIAMVLPVFMISPRAAPPRVVVVPWESPPGLIEELASAGDIRVEVAPPPENVTRLVLDEGADLVVEIPAGFTENLSAGGTGEVRIYYDPYSMRAVGAIVVVRGALASYEERIVEERLREKNLTMQYIDPVEEAEYQITRTGRAVSPGALIGAAVLPMMVALIAMTGAGTFALDMIAGERERKTIEALLTSPASRGEILAGKYLAMLLLSTISGVSTLISAVVGLYVMGTMILPSPGEVAGQLANQTSASVVASLLPEGVDPWTLLMGVGAGVVIAGLTGNAIITMTSSFAKSFKEAQQYVGGAVMVLILPMIAVPYAPRSWAPALRVVPIGSIAMMMKDLLLEPTNPAAWGLSAVSSLAYLAIFLAVSAKLFGRESVIMG